MTEAQGPACGGHAEGARCCCSSRCPHHHHHHPREARPGSFAPCLTVTWVRGTKGLPQFFRELLFAATPELTPQARESIQVKDFSLRGREPFAPRAPEFFIPLLLFR